MTFCAIAEDRGVIAVAGADRVAFLQGLVSGDVRVASGGRALWSALLTPQGKYLHDMFIAEAGDALLIDCERERADDLVRRLKPYRLRARAAFEDRRETWRVARVWGPAAPAALGLPAERGAAAVFAGGVAFVDPRLVDGGVRVMAPAVALPAALTAAGAAAATDEDWRRHRTPLGLPEGAQDIAIGKGALLEYGFDELNGVSWSKGCYMGQELTARTRYRGLVKKRLAPVRIAGEAPPSGAPLTFRDAAAGEMRSAAGDWGLALIKRDALKAATDPSRDEPGVLRWRDTRLTPTLPAWLKQTIHPEAVDPLERSP